MGITARHLNRFVSHQFLNPAHVNSRHGETASEGVARVMPRKVSNACLLYRILKPVTIAEQWITPSDTQKHVVRTLGPRLQEL
jgi:hypothetical protein